MCLSVTTRPLKYTLFPYTTLFRSDRLAQAHSRPQAALQFRLDARLIGQDSGVRHVGDHIRTPLSWPMRRASNRSEEHTSELQSRENLVCRLLLEKKKSHRSQQNTP